MGRTIQSFAATYLRRAAFAVASCVSVSASGAPLPAQLRGGVPEGLPGIEIRDGKFIGESRSAKILQCLTSRSGYSIFWYSLPTPRLLRMLGQKELDLAFPMGFSSDRSKEFKASDPVFRSEDLWIHYDAAINTRDKSLSIAVKDASPQHSWLQQNGYTNLSVVPHYASLLPMLQKRRIQAILVASSEAALASEMAPYKDMIKTLNLVREVGFYFPQNHRVDAVRALNYTIAICTR